MPKLIAVTHFLSETKNAFTILHDGYDDAIHQFKINASMYIRMFHNFIFFEIKNAWGLIRSDFGHNEEIKKIFFDYSLF